MIPRVDLSRVVTLAALFGLSLALAAADPNPMSDLAQSLQPGQWKELPSNLSRALLTGDGGTVSIIADSEDGVWDPLTKRFYFIGGSNGFLAGLQRD